MLSKQALPTNTTCPACLITLTLIYTDQVSDVMPAWNLSTRKVEDQEFTVTSARLDYVISKNKTKRPNNNKNNNKKTTTNYNNHKTKTTTTKKPKQKKLNGLLSLENLPLLGKDEYTSYS